MQKTNYGRTAQGESLPKFKKLGLSDTSRHVAISRADGLDIHRRGWRVRHQQAVSKPKTTRTSSPLPGTQPGIYPVLVAWAGNQRKCPHCAVPLFRQCFAATRSALFNEQGISQMIFTFLIASRACRLVDLSRIRTIIAVADTEARIALAGLPLMFLSRTPNKGVVA